MCEAGLVRKLVLVICLTLAGRSAQGWWDTQLTEQKPPPTIATLLAQNSPDLDPRFIVEDASARGGQAVRIEAGGATLRMEQALAPSHYVLYVIGRASDPAFVKPAPPVVLHLQVTNLDSGQQRGWRTRVAFTSQWHDVGRLYFPVYEPGRYRMEIFAGPRSTAALLVDFVELKDVLGHIPRRGEKRGRNLTSAQELSALRRLPASRALAERLAAEQAAAGLAAMTPEQARQWRRQTFEDLWAMVPPRNLHHRPGATPPALRDYVQRATQAAGGVQQWTLRQQRGPFVFEHPTTGATYTLENWQRGEVAGEVAFPDDGTGFHAPRRVTQADEPFDRNWLGAALVRRYRALTGIAEDKAEQYLRTGNELAGWEGLCALLAFVEMYPDIDLMPQQFNFTGTQFGITNENLGKFVAAHNTKWIVSLFKAYDHLFPLIDGNQELAALLHEKLAWVQAPADVITFVDSNLLQHYRDAVARLIARAPEGESEAMLSVAAVVQGPGPAGDWMWEHIFTKNYWRMQFRGGIQDHLWSTINRDGVTSDVGSAEYTKASAGSLAILYDSARRYQDLGGKLPFDITDLAAYPKLRLSAYYPLQRKAAGVFTPRIGDWGTAADPPQLDEQAVFLYARQTYLFGFGLTGDPRFAWLLRHFGRDRESDEEWAAIEAAAAVQPDNPFLLARTRHLPGFGMTILEAHPDDTNYRHKAAVVLRTGVGMNHGHADQLNLIYYAHGTRLLPDHGRRYRAPAWNNGISGGLGPRPSWWDQTPGGRTSRVHNLVEVDQKDFLNVAYNRTGVGWTEATADLQGVGYARASAIAQSHPHLSTFQRDVALVPVGADHSYVVDVFRVAGGRVHTMISPGPVTESPRLVSFNTPMSDPPAPLLERYPGPGFHELLHGACPPTLQVTWELEPGLVSRYRGPEAQTPRVFLRTWRLGVAGLPVIRGFTRVHDWTGHGTSHNFVFVRHESEQELQGAYTTVTEGFLNDRPLVQAVAPLTAVDTADAGAARGLRLELVNGRRDVVYMDGAGEQRVRLDQDIQVQGQFAHIAQHAGQVQQVALLGGTHLSVEGVVLEPEVARYSARVTGVDLAANTVTLDQALPDGALDGVTVHVRRPARHNASYIVKRSTGNTLLMRGPMIVFQSALKGEQRELRGVETELPPPLIVALPTYYDGLPIWNEAGQLLGRARVAYGQRWMYLGYPEHRQWRQRISLEEIVDADGDGRRTLRVHAVRQIKQWLGEDLGVPRLRPIGPGEHMTDLEVTRVSADGLTLWFKDPAERFTYSYDIPHDSWPYQGMHLFTEDGRRMLYGNYPGREYAFTLEGRDLGRADFPDEDGDGRRLVIVSDIAPGDPIDAPTQVSLRRRDGAAWELHANVAVRLTLPLGGRPVQVLTGAGDRVQPAEAARRGDSLHLSAQTVLRGPVTIVSGGDAPAPAPPATGR